MRISNITLTNYRLYKGTNKISFPKDDKKNIYLISGQNGFGKTTFLHSLLWCLYGRLMADIDESIRKDILIRGGYNSFLQSNLNIEDKQIIDNLDNSDLLRIKRQGYALDFDNLKDISVYSVAIEFTDVFIPSIPCKSLKIKRSYDVILEKEFVDILIDGEINKLSDQIGCDVFINDFILNKDIARFFFFDSERIVALAETNTLEEKRRLSSAYNEVLGVKKYEDLKKNLENLRLRFRKRTADVESRKRLQFLLDKKEKIETSMQLHDTSIQELENYLNKLRAENQNLQESLIREGNSTTLENLNRLEKVIEVTKKKDIEYKEKLESFMEYAPFAISGDLLIETKKQLDRDYEIIKSANNVSNQNILISDITSDIIKAISNINLDLDSSLALQDNIQKVLDKYKGVESSEEQLINISKEDYEEFLSVFNNVTGTYKVEFERLAEDYRKNKLTLERSSRQISNMKGNESDAVIKEIRSQKNIIEEKISEKESEIKQYYENRGTTIKELATVNKQISELSKKVSLDDSDVKKDKVAEQLVEELDKFLSNLKQEKKYSLEYRIKNAMNTLMHKEDFVGSVKVHIIDDGIDIDLYFPDGRTIRKDTLSKGEQQLYATSILKALVDESEIEFPVFIDSPLQKFDKSHSNKIITEFYPSISKQVVLFPLLHKELTKQELDLMKPLVKSSYLIVNENSRSYFKEIDVEHLMND